MKKKLIAFMAVCIMFLTCVSNISAQEISPRANDTVSRNYSQVFSYNKYFCFYRSRCRNGRNAE